VDPLSPYFAHLRLRENGAERDLCLGRATRIERGIRIVDWRNAPVSRIFYRYQQGDEYEEEFAGRAREGQVTARRTVRIRDGVLDRIEAPEGVFTAAQGSWRRTEVAPARLAGGEATALRAHAVDQGDERRLGTDLEGDRRRADKHLPEITSLIDPAQFGLITRSASRTWPSTTRTSTRSARSSWSSPPDCATTSATCCPPSESRTCAS
jgi:DNA helicase-2/ATP-dependent DNA helicase PcrA